MAFEPVDEFSAAEAADVTEKLTEVPDGPELLRILALARRPTPDPEGGEALELAAWLTGTLRRRPDGPLYPGPLTGTQALALREGKSLDGGFFPMRPGAGKTLFCALMAALYIQAGYERVMVVVPASARAQTKAEFDRFARDWKCPDSRQVMFVNYELLSHENSAADPDGSRPSYLHLKQPQVMLFDEAHNVANASSACTRLVRYYLLDHPNTIVFGMTGTPFIRSIKDAAEMLEWSLKERSPLPRRGHWKELNAWASYLDPKTGAFGRIKAGALMQLERAYGDGTAPFYDERLHSEAVSATRQALARRILETPGVIGTAEPALDIPLTMEPWIPDQLDPALEEAYSQVVSKQELPDGTPIADKLSSYRHLYRLGYAHWNEWSPSPPDEWKLAFRAWGKWCRRALRYNKHKLSSEAQLKRALSKGLYASGKPKLAAWEAASAAYTEDTGLPEPPSVARWVNEGQETVEAVRQWVREHHGLVWVNSVGLGEKLAAELGIPYYGAGTVDASGRSIREHPGGPAIASLDACGTGLQLTYWNKALFLCTPGEQVLARLHRRGQTAPVVRNWLYIGCAAHLDSYHRARDVKAKFASDMTLDEQRLEKVQCSLPSVFELGMRPGVRWQSKALDDD